MHWKVWRQRIASSRLLTSRWVNGFKIFESIRNDSKSKSVRKIPTEGIPPHHNPWTLMYPIRRKITTQPNPKSRTLGIIWVEAKGLWMTFSHMWTAASIIENGLKLLLYISRYQLGIIFYKLLKSTETITGDCYWLQLICLSRALN